MTAHKGQFVRVQVGVMTVGAVGVLVLLAGDRSGGSFRALGFSALVVALASGAYLALTSILYIVARLFRSRRARRLLMLLTFQRARQVAVGMALLTHWAPAPAAANAESAPVHVDRGTATSPTLDMFLYRFGLHADPTPEFIPSTYTVALGDSFWRIAERQVRLVNPDADVRTVATYWLDVVQENFDQLVVAGNPDLLYVGQVLTLPPFSGKVG